MKRVDLAALRTHAMGKNAGTDWPPIEATYTEESGQVEPVVYEAAGALWKSRGELFAALTLGDTHLGLELMLRAVVSVSRVYRDPEQQIASLSGYLFKSYKRLVLTELEKQNGHRRLEAERAEELAPRHGEEDEDLEKKLEVQRLRKRMDQWTRDIFGLLTIGYTFEEIGRMRGTSGHGIGNQYNRKLKRLAEELAAEAKAAEKKRALARLKGLLLFVLAVG